MPPPTTLHILSIYSAFFIFSSARCWTYRFESQCPVKRKTEDPQQHLPQHSQEDTSNVLWLCVCLCMHFNNEDTLMTEKMTLKIIEYEEIWTRIIHGGLLESSCMDEQNEYHIYTKMLYFFSKQLAYLQQCWMRNNS